MTNPDHHSSHHADHHHGHGHAIDHVIGHDGLAAPAWSLMRLSAWARIVGAAILLIPLWIAVLLVTA